MRLFLMRLKKKQCLLSKITLSAHQTGQQCLKKSFRNEKTNFNVWSVVLIFLVENNLVFDHIFVNMLMNVKCEYPRDDNNNQKPRNH